jgi:hypothetical protein
MAEFDTMTPQSSLSSDENRLPSKEKTFTFRYKPEKRTILKCTLESRPCQKEGCTKTNNYPIEYCTEHLKSEMGLCIKPSTLILENGQRLKEDGLFACHKTDRIRKTTPVFHTETIICKYNGRILEQKDAPQYWNRSNMEDTHDIMPYSLIETKSKRIIDASCVRGIGAFANHKPMQECNAAFVMEKKEVAMIALKTIYDGDEIFLDYGYDPVLEFQDYEYETK